MSVALLALSACLSSRQHPGTYCSCLSKAHRRYALCQLAAGLEHLQQVHTPAQRRICKDRTALTCFQQWYGLVYSSTVVSFMFCFSPTPILAIVQIKAATGAAGPELGKMADKLMQWQLAHPDASQQDAEQWLTSSQ